MSSLFELKAALKRGALIAVANWPVTVVQAVADSLSKVVIAAPLVGGVFLVALVAGAEPVALMSLQWRELAATIVGALVSRPPVLAAFLFAIGVAVIGVSLLVFLVKGGTVDALIRGERQAGPVEQPPLHLHAVGQASAFSLEQFVNAAQTHFPRYARLGCALMAVYLVSGLLFLAAVFAGRNAGGGWSVTALATVAFVGWVTVVNFVYLLVQVVIVADDCPVVAAAGRVAVFLRRDCRRVLAVFSVILLLVVLATGASVLATAALGLIGFVPLFGLALLPIQLLAWALRGLVFQYIGLSAVGAYASLYRSSSAQAFAARSDPVASRHLRSHEPS